MLKEEHFEHESYGRAVCSPTVLIMSPTRELASQIYSEGHKFCFNTNIKVAVVYGGTDVGCQLDRMVFYFYFGCCLINSKKKFKFKLTNSL